MNINDFVSQRKEDWKKLEVLASKFKPGSTPKLSRDELWELGKLYTGAIADLSLLKASGLGSEADNRLVAYLNSLVIKVHGAIYRERRIRWRAVLEFLQRGFPTTFRKGMVYVLFSAGLFLTFLAVGFVLGINEPGFVELVLPDRIIEHVEEGKVWFNHLYSIAPQASSMLMTHNVSVTFFIVAAGVTFGVGTFYLLALNGLFLGCAAALCHLHGLSLEFWSFVLPHGSLELSAIWIGGGAGFVIGEALLDPGPYRRADYLSVRGPLAARLALGCVPMLVLAGITEAFFSPSPLPPWVKIVYAGGVFTALVTYLMTAGAGNQEEAGAESNP